MPARIFVGVASGSAARSATSPGVELDPLGPGAAEGVAADHVAEDVDDVTADERTGGDHEEADDRERDRQRRDRPGRRRGCARETMRITSATTINVAWSVARVQRRALGVAVVGEAGRRRPAP